MSKIVLTTLNARYIHASLGLRYLYANLAELRDDARIVEYVIASRPSDIVEDLLKLEPLIIGFGVYIWNVEHTTQVIAMLKQIRPDIIVIVGGPEVSYETEQQTIVKYADVCITGPADKKFYQICRDFMRDRKPLQKVVAAEFVPMDELIFPYEFYSDDDIKNRIIYVEASRGCPFKCEFCLSALDKTAWPFNLEQFLEAMQSLYLRGVRHFKFVDRTFNLKIDTSIRILEFFLERLDEKLFLHFELIPDHLPEKLKAVIERFPAGSLQFEIGVQTFDETVQALISRKQNNAKAEDNIRWLSRQTHAHLHTDLIAGLPGETLQSFAAGFNRLIALDPHETQLGILKRLRGTPIIRHTDAFQMRYNPFPPYNVLSTSTMDFATVQRLTRFARYWDVIANSGRFPHTRASILRDRPFENFLALSDWLYEKSGSTHQLALERIIDWLYEWLVNHTGLDAETVRTQLTEDFILSGLKTLPRCIDLERIKQQRKKDMKETVNTAQRQARHAAHGKE